MVITNRLTSYALRLSAGFEGSATHWGLYLAANWFCISQFVLVYIV